MTHRNSPITKALAAFAVIVALAGCAAFSGRETAGEYVDDTTVTTRVKAKIFEDASLKSMQINVETMKDVVQLSGFVDSTQAKTRRLVMLTHKAA